MTSFCGRAPLRFVIDDERNSYRISTIPEKLEIQLREVGAFAGGYRIVWGRCDIYACFFWKMHKNRE